MAASVQNARNKVRVLFCRVTPPFSFVHLMTLSILDYSAEIQDDCEWWIRGSKTLRLFNTHACIIPAEGWSKAENCGLWTEKWTRRPAVGLWNSYRPYFRGNRDIWVTVQAADWLKTHFSTVTFIDRQVTNDLFLCNVMHAVLVGEVDQFGSVECPDAPLLLMPCPIQNPDQRQCNVIVNNEFWRWMDRLYLMKPFHFLGYAASKGCVIRER